MDTMEIISKIPVDQSAPATAQLKRYWLEKVKEIRMNRSVLEKEARYAQREKIIDSYKKSVGYDKLDKRLKKLDREADDLKIEIRRLGIDPSCGNLLEINENGRTYNADTRQYEYYTQEQIDRVNKVKDLIKAVEREVGVFSPMDQLEARMMMASTVGELMAVVNGVAGRDVFKIDLGQLKLEDTK